MHIIKITPHSFKIILTKDDLNKYGVDNIMDHSNISGNFFAEIIEKTNYLYDNPFSEGAIDAEFFESKDGGGELFICSSKCTNKITTYLFRTDNSDFLASLSKRLFTSFAPIKSSLYFDDGKYNLILHYQNRNEMILSCLKEYGSAAEISKVQLWLLEEHAKVLCKDNAVITLARGYSV